MSTEGSGAQEITVGPVSMSTSSSFGIARLGQRSYMSSWMLRSAKRSSDMAQEIERMYCGVWKSPHVEEHMDHVISAVLSSATFLEAMVNELFTDAYEGHGLEKDGYLAPLDAEVVRLMAAWWEETDQGFDRTLAKYQLLLTFAGRDKLDRGSEPLQSASLLLSLRNAVVHYKPKTIYSDVPHDIEKRLQGRFKTNELMPARATRGWPNGILSAGCASWAHESAEALADEVASRLGIVPNYQRVQGRPAPT